MQREGIDFEETFAPVEVYVQQPQGYEIVDEENKVYKLTKALYGLKQAPRAWYDQINGHFKLHGFHSSESEPTLYVKLRGNDEVFLSRFMQNPSKLHYGTTKRVLRYLKGTSSYGIWYTNNVENFQLCGYSDSDRASSVDDRRSTTGYIFNLGLGAITWSSQKQLSPTLSSSEAEYIAVTSAACQVVWLRRILEDMKQHQKVPTVVHCDNQSTIAMTRNSIFYNRTRHIETWHHFIRELVDKGSIKMSYCSTDE
ncbi:hypothetical protein LWI29_011456 [Acer saccharum]|uniref:Reverse transcriptase Ty1/copia-type domain-containing protein n=1 Tax=Acer saccharum TaxID=4024 RepID=A0AA39VFR5_ACESA|nr:hypothetical protein LWI29_011456 [Acer saccharum]